MADYNFKVPTSQEEMDALRASLRRELSESELEGVAGGNDDLKGKFNPPVNWTCPFCDATMLLRMFQDGPKHVTKCPNNPYK